MSHAESMFRAIENVSGKEMVRYDMTFDEMSAMYQKASGDMFRAISWAFKYGFVKGKRCEKAVQKRKEKAA